jgi:glucokinase
MNVLAGDIGGTKSRLAIYNIGPLGLSLSTKQTYPSAAFGCVTEMISSFLEWSHTSCEIACLGLPGPVSQKRMIRLTNLPWTVDHDQIRRAAGTERIALINDVEASAAGVCELAAEEVECLHEGEPDPTGNRAVISVGTGLGVAGLTASGRAFATEAGHASFSPRADFDVDVLRTLRGEFGHVSWERLASGPALPRIYSHLRAKSSVELDAPEIVSRCATDTVCRQAVEIFCRYLGAAAGNIALTLMATGGVYFCGGVAPRVIDEIGYAAILDSFFDKGRMRNVLERIPVSLVRDDYLALKGAAHTALRLFDCSPETGARDLEVLQSAKTR